MLKKNRNIGKTYFNKSGNFLMQSRHKKNLIKICFKKKVIKKGQQQLKGKVSLVLFFNILNPLF